MGIVSVGVCFMLCAAFVISLTETGDADSAANGTLTGKTLYEIGRRYNKAWLMLVGKSLMNLKCQQQYHRCDEWSDWSSCELFVGQFGMKTRERQCRTDDRKGCDTKPNSKNYMKVENESQVCSSEIHTTPLSCPSKYELFQDDICLYFHTTTKKGQADSVADCQNDGGHLMTINSPKKWTVFASLIDKYNYRDYVWVDGRRKDLSSPWEYASGDVNSGYLDNNWVPGHPQSYNCLAAIKSSSTTGFGAGSCSGIAIFYVCEAMPM